MDERTYLRPVGRLTLPPDRANTPLSRVVRVGDRDDVVFMGLELLQRPTGGGMVRRMLSHDELCTLTAEASPNGRRLGHIVQQLSVARTPIGDLAFDRPRIMGIVNVTPDSFSDGNLFVHSQDAIAHALALEQAGADIIDIGGESTRPGAEPVPLELELARVMPVIEGLVGRTRARLSIDTRKAEVMRRAAVSGIHMINDVSALTHDPQSLRVATDVGLPVVLMHAQGDPRTMQAKPQYDDVLLDVYDWLEARVEACVRAGMARERLIVDFGIGFGKTAAHNYELIAGASLFHGLGCGILLGASRKSFIGTLTGAVDPADRMPGSVAAALAGAMQGVQILRVHDVAETRQALSVWETVTAGAAVRI